MGFLAGKRLLITGLLSNRSIAYGIAKACQRDEDARFRRRIFSHFILSFYPKVFSNGVIDAC